MCVFGLISTRQVNKIIYVCKHIWMQFAVNHASNQLFFQKNKFDFKTLENFDLVISKPSFAKPPTIAVFSRNPRRRRRRKKSLEKLSKVLNAFLDCSNSFVICSSYTHLLPISTTALKRGLQINSFSFSFYLVCSRKPTNYLLFQKF